MSNGQRRRQRTRQQQSNQSGGNSAETTASRQSRQSRQHTHDQRAQEEPLWTREDAQRYLKVAERTIYRYVHDGRLPHSKVGGLLRFVPADVRAFATPGRRPGQSHTTQPAEGRNRDADQ